MDGAKISLWRFTNGFLRRSVESFLRRLPNFSDSHLRARGAVELRSNLRRTDGTQIRWGPFTAACCAI
jgi:hypothetical protein